MPKLEAVAAAALCGLLLSSCGAQEPAAGANAAAPAEENGAANPSSGASGAAPQPAAPDNGAEPVPPPDAVSHPNGYLPPAPAEPGAPAPNSSGTDPSGPATEDQYIRNGQ